MLVSDAHPVDRVAGRRGGRAAAHGRPAADAGGEQACRAKRDARIDLDGLERLVPDAHGLVIVDEDQRAAARVAAGDFALGRRAGELARAQIRELAVVLQSDWRDLGLTP